MYIGEWRWLDFANTPGVLDWVAFVVGTGGIAFAIWQLLRSKSALEAARDALESTRESLVKNQLVAVLPAFTEISRTVDSALSSVDREPMQMALGRFTDQAHEAAILLRDATDGYEKLAAKILRTADTASRARAALFELPMSTSVQEIAGAAATEIRYLAPHILGVATTLRNDPGKAHNAR